MKNELWLPVGKRFPDYQKNMESMVVKQKYMPYTIAKYYIENDGSLRISMKNYLGEWDSVAKNVIFPAQGVKNEKCS